MTIGKYIQAALITGLALFVMAGSANASTVACSTLATLQGLLNMTTAGNNCSDGNVLFSNFSYSGGQAASTVNANPVLVVNAGTGVYQYGWIFDATQGSSWLTNFTLSYTITMAAGNSFELWYSKDQMNTAPIGNPITLNDVQTGVLPSPIHLTSSSESQFSSTYHQQSVTTSTTATISAGAMGSYEQYWFERDTSVPEPATLSLIGGALLGLGVMLRRKKA
jgi:hypothetical protein